MKGIFFWVGGDVNDSSSIIARKIKNQMMCFEKAGHPMIFIGVENRRNFAENIKWFLPGVYNYTQNQMVHAFDNIDLKEYGFIYFRMPTVSPPLLDMLKRIREKNESIKIIMEIPTYPVLGERKGLKKIADEYAKGPQKKLYKYVDRVVTFSKDDIIWKMPTIRTVNCADMTTIKKKKISKNESINVITVSSYDFWHGYDRFIKGMGEYYSNGGTANIKYYLVGAGAEIPKYRSMVEEYNLKDRVIFEGKKFGKELDEMYDLCEIALDSMGRHRSHTSYNSSLKGKEYCAKGLPIVSGVETELDSMPEYNYYIRVPADDSMIDMNLIINFYNKCYENKNKADVVDEIRDFAEKHFSFEVGLTPVIDYINSKGR